MERRGAGMGPMMPFFPGSGITEQPAAMGAPEMPFPHMRERFPNNVWAPENQSQWGAFHPPNLSASPMGPPTHNPHQFNQYEPRQPVFNFGSTGTPAAPTVTTTPVSQFNSGFSSQFNGVPSDPNVPFVPQGHYSPQQNATGSVQFNSGPPNGFLTHPQGNGVIGNPTAHPHIGHTYPTAANEFHHQQPQQQHHQIHSQQQNHLQQGVFKSPAVSAPEASPVHSGYAMTTLPSPHGHNSMPNDQTAVATCIPSSVHTSPAAAGMVTSYPNHVGTECASMPQTSPHTSIANNTNGNNTVQSRLKNMIMSRQGSNGSQSSSAFSPGPALTESPPLGELRFSGSVAAVTSVVSSSEASQVQESFKMAENFLAYRTTEPDPGSVVQHSSGDKGTSGEDNSTTTSKHPDLCAMPSAINEYKSSQSNFLGSAVQSQPVASDANKYSSTSDITGSTKCMEGNEADSRSKFREPEEALEQLFNDTGNNDMQNLFKDSNQMELSTNASKTLALPVSTNNDPPDKAKTCGEEGKQNFIPLASNQTVPSSTHPSLTHLSSTVITTSVTSSVTSLESIGNMTDTTSSLPFPMHGKSEENFLDGKNSLSVYDFPDSPDQQMNSEPRSGFRLGRNRGVGIVSSPSTTITSHLPLASASLSTAESGVRLTAPGTSVEGSSVHDGGLLPKSGSISHPLAGSHHSHLSSFLPHSSSVPAKLPRNERVAELSTYAKTPQIPGMGYPSMQGHSLTSTTQSLQTANFSQPQLSNLSTPSFQDFSQSQPFGSQPYLPSQTLPFSSSAAPYNMNPVVSQMNSSTSLQTSSVEGKPHHSGPLAGQSTMQSPTMIPHPSPQSITRQSPLNLPRLSPQALPTLSPQNNTQPSSLPSSLSSPQNPGLQQSPKVSSSQSSPSAAHHTYQNMQSNSSISHTMTSSHAMGQTGPSHLPQPSPNSASSQQMLNRSSNSANTSPQNSNTMQPFQPSSQPVGHPPQTVASNSMPMLSPQSVVQNRNMTHQNMPMQSHSTASSGFHNVAHPGHNVCPMPSQTVPSNSPHHMNNSGPGFSNFYHPYPQLPHQPFPHQFHPQHKFSQMQLMQPGQGHFHPNHHPIKNMTNFVMHPNAMQSPLTPDAVMPKASPKKAAPKKPRKTRVTKKQKLAMEKQQKEELEKARLQELQREKMQKEEMEKAQFRELQLQQGHFQQPLFMRNKMGPQFQNQHEMGGSGMAPSHGLHDFMPQQWPQGFPSGSIPSNNPQNMHPLQQGQSSLPLHSQVQPQLSAFSQPQKVSRGSETKNSRKKKTPEIPFSNSSDFSSLANMGPKIPDMSPHGPLPSLPGCGDNAVPKHGGPFNPLSYLQQKEHIKIEQHSNPASDFMKELSMNSNPSFNSQFMNPNNQPFSAGQPSTASHFSNSFSSSHVNQNIPGDARFLSSGAFPPNVNNPLGLPIGSEQTIKQEPLSSLTMPQPSPLTGLESIGEVKQEVKIKSEMVQHACPPQVSTESSVNQFPSFGSDSFPFGSADKTSIFGDSRNASGQTSNTSNLVNPTNTDLTTKAPDPSGLLDRFNVNSQPSSAKTFEPNQFKEENTSLNLPGFVSFSNEQKPTDSIASNPLPEPNSEATVPSCPPENISRVDLLTKPSTPQDQLSTIDPTPLSTPGTLANALPDPVAAMQYPPFGGQVPLEPSEAPLTEEEEWKRKLKLNEFIAPKCSCSISPGTQESGPVYSHLGHGFSVADVRKSIEERTGHLGSEVRIEKVVYTGKEGKTESGCPLPKWIIRRSGENEKVLVVVKNRAQHSCVYSWIVVVVVAWEGMPQETADDLYTTLVDKLNKFGTPTERRCGTNEERTCVCQGVEKTKCGASFSFGCSWSMYYNMCKFARSRNSRKFKLTDDKEEIEIEDKLQKLATELSPVYDRFAPLAYRNQVALEDDSLECRLGNAQGRPWTGVTACLDFCAHSHKDNHNMNNGCTVVATMTKHRSWDKAEDEQYHVLPLYVLDSTDEEGVQTNFEHKIKSGALEVLDKYPCEIRVRSEPLLSCRARSLLARGLPLPNTNRGKMGPKGRGGKARSKIPMDIVTFRRKSVDDSGLSGVPKRKWDAKEVSDKLGLDVDLLLKSGDLEQEDYDDLGKYNIDNEDWQLGLENEGEKAAGESSSFEEGVNDPAKKEIQTGEGLPTPFSQYPSSSVVGTSENVSPAAVGDGVSQSSMPPPASPAKRLSSPVNTSFSAVQASSPAAASPFSGSSGPPVIHPQSPNDPGSNPFSPQMPSLSPHGMQTASPRSPPPLKNSNAPDPIAVGAVAGPASMYVGQGMTSVPSNPSSLFSASLNSPEMPRLSPHVTSLTSALAKPDKPISGLALSESNPSCSSPTTHLNDTMTPPAETEPVETYLPEGTCVNSGSEGSKEGTGDHKPFSYVSFSENLENFKDPIVGGVSIALSHRSVLFEYAKQELHATTALKAPDRTNPKRLSLIFYHHKNLIHRNHGWTELENKMLKKKEVEKAKSVNETAEPQKRKRATKPTAKDKAEGVRMPPNGIKKIKIETMVEMNQGAPSKSSPSGTITSPHFHPNPNFGVVPSQTDLISPPSSGSAYQRSVPSVGDNGTQPFSPSSQRSATLTPSFSIPSKSPHLSLKSPSLDTALQHPKPSPQSDAFGSSHLNHIPAGQGPPFTGSQQEFNPYNTPGSSPYHNQSHFSPYSDMQPNPSFLYQPGNFFPKGPTQPSPMNYNNTTYVPQPFYGLTPPYSPGPQQQQQQQQTQHMAPHHMPSQMNAGPFPHGGLPPGMASSLTYEESVIRNMAVSQHPTGWQPMRHMPPFSGHSPYSPWPGS